MPDELVQPAPPRRRPTMMDVARHAGVSLKTVSRVVNNEPAVAQPLADRVLAAIAELGFRRNDIARNLRSGQVNATVGLLVEDIADPICAIIVSVATQIAAGRRTLLLTAASGADPERERQLLLELTQRRVDGLLVVPAGQDHSFLRREVELGMPVVFLDRPAERLVADAVLLDNRGGARDGVRALVSAGHRRIGILLDTLRAYPMRERLAGAQAELATAGLAYDDALVRDGVKTPDQAARVVAEMLRLADPPTAFFGANHRITVGALTELHRRGSDAALLGFDDFELSHLMPRPVTLIAYDPRQLARVATQRLFDRIGGDQSWPATTILPTHLVHRGLAGPG
jgi:LacI family transcriptional regulator